MNPESSSGDPLPRDALRQRREHTQARRAQARRRRLTLVLVLALLVGGATAAALGGGGAAAIPPAAPHPVQIVVAASGDLLIHSPVWEQAQADGGGSHYDFRPMFSQIKPYVQSADLPLCHVETPVTPSPPTGYPIFNAPPALATAVHATGWKACSTAATHALDGGQKGIDESSWYSAPAT